MGETLTFENAVKIGMDFAGRVKAMTDGQVLLTGEFPDVYVLDHLLSSHYGTEAPSDELKDFALASGVYVAVLLARFWKASGLQSFWREQGIADCGIGLELTGEDQKGHEFFLTCPADVYGMVTQPPNPFPQFVGSWMTLRKGDPLLPRYVLGALLLSQPLAHGDWPKLPPGEGAFLQGHLSQDDRNHGPLLRAGPLPGRWPAPAHPGELLRMLPVASRGCLRERLRRRKRQGPGGEDGLLGHGEQEVRHGGSGRDGEGVGIGRGLHRRSRLQGLEMSG